MKRFVEGEDRSQSALFSERLDDYVSEDNPVLVDAHRLHIEPVSSKTDQHRKSSPLIPDKQTAPIRLTQTPATSSIYSLLPPWTSTSVTT